MNKKWIYFLICLMTAALVGIIAIQLFWITNAFKIEETAFDRKVNQVLTEIVSKLEGIENNFSVSEKLLDENSISFVTLELGPDSSRLTFHHYGDTLTNTMLIPQELVSDLPGLGQVLLPSQNKFIIPMDTLYSRILSLDVKTELTQAIRRIFDSRAKRLRQIFNEMVAEDLNKKQLIENRVKVLSLKSQIAYVLDYYDIAYDFEYAIISENRDPQIVYTSEGFKEEFLDTKYKLKLFPNDIYEKSDYLIVYFPDKKTVLLKSISLLLMISFLFTLIIILTFFFTLYVILKQKKISEIKSDFINNMTHEFKTPLATISLSVDSINNPQVYKNKEKLDFYTDIIKEENKRMNSQVEKVLQMSLLEKKDIQLQNHTVNIHSSIREAIKNISILAKEKKGKIEDELNASEYYINADEIHFVNIIYNLLDNAIKYCDKIPDISVKTTNVNNSVLISVKDNGIGISKENRKKIFDKMYRVPTGNIHNVKGFGLGLSYVHSVVAEFGGSIKVKSEPGKGSEFEILLPVIIE
ncbi:sensor histidine kinase [Bacteroidota bacterium]